MKAHSSLKQLITCSKFTLPATEMGEKVIFFTAGGVAELLM
jgi:hypothetical protein